MASEPCGKTTFASEPAPSLPHQREQWNAVHRTANLQEEGLSRMAHRCIIGTEASRDWLDIHTLPDG